MKIFNIPIPYAEKGQPNGVATLDVTGKVPLSQIPASIIGGLNYKGPWDASGGTMPVGPAKGDYYIISVQGTLPVVGFAEVGDMLACESTGPDVWTLYQGNLTVGDLIGQVQENGANLNANEIVETDGSKKHITAAKGTAYNKNFGIAAGEVTEGDKPVLLAGRSGGQIVKGGTGSGDDIELTSSSHATKGLVKIGDFAAAKQFLEIDENNKWGTIWQDGRYQGPTTLAANLVNKGFVTNPENIVPQSKQIDVYYVSGARGDSGFSGGIFSPIDTISNAIAKIGSASYIHIIIDETVTSEIFTVPAAKTVYISGPGGPFKFENSHSAIIGDGGTLIADNIYFSLIKEDSGISDGGVYLEECNVDSITDFAGTGDPTNLGIYVWGSWIDTSVISRINNAGYQQGYAVDYNTGNVVLFIEPTADQHAATKKYVDSLLSVSQVEITPEDMRGWTESGTITFGAFRFTEGGTNHISIGRYIRGDANNSQGSLMAQIVLPPDFDSFGTNHFVIRTRRNATLDAFTISLIKDDDTVDTAINGATVNPTAVDTFQVFSFTPAGSYSAGDRLIIKATADVDDTERAYVGYVLLKYNRKVKA